jgi:hypothetical protein
MIFGMITHYLCFLVDLRDFPIKSLSLVFNFWETENLFFHILLFRGPFGRLKIKGKKILDQFFIEIKAVG